MPSTIIVTAADARFFHLLAGLLRSIESQRGTSDIVIGCFDLGLTAGQRAWVETKVNHRIVPGWDLKVPGTWRVGNPHWRALTVRPFLPRHFPGYDTYIWIDSDIWLQDWKGIELYCLGAGHADITATPHTDRAYPFDAGVQRFRHRQFNEGFGNEVADALAPQQHLNAGMFAASADSQLWGHWAEAFQEAIDRSEGKMYSDQIALNYAVFMKQLTVHLLPGIYNWQCHLALPCWNQRTKQFCEPHLPHAPISVMHLTHKSKDRVHDVRALDSRTHRMSLQNPAVESSARALFQPVTKSDVAP